MGKEKNDIIHMSDNELARLFMLVSKDKGNNQEKERIYNLCVEEINKRNSK